MPTRPLPGVPCSEDRAAIHVQKFVESFVMKDSSDALFSIRPGVHAFWISHETWIWECGAPTPLRPKQLSRSR
jgi:hypothetical protein